MFRVALVNMPFASLKFPSLALTQLDAALSQRFGNRLDQKVLYLNHDFARRLGTERYQYIAVDMEAPYNGLGDWFFRQAAFPELPDNTELYFQRFFPRMLDKDKDLRQFIEDKREEIDDFFEDVIEAYRLDEADIVGFTSMFSQTVACFALARKLKERNPEGLIVMGGANCEYPMGESMVHNVDAIDYVFSGNALRSFPQFIDHCMNGRIDALATVPGVLGGALADIGTNPTKADQELPLDEPLELNYGPFLDAVEQNFASDGIEPILLFETSRGCWWGEKAHCTFCGLNGTTMNYRSMDAKLARRQIQSLFQYSDRVSRLQSVDNIMPKHYPQEVFADLGTPEHMTIFYEVKADLSADDMKTLAAAGVREVQPGIEALATKTLKLMRKGTTVFQNLRFLKDCITYGIFPDWSVLVGFPGEGEEVYEKYVRDIPSLVHLPPPSGAYPVRPDRFSPYHVNPDEYGMVLKPTDFYELVYPFDAETVEKLAYFFRDVNFGAQYFDEMVQWFPRVREIVDGWRDRWDSTDGSPPSLHFEGEGQADVIHDSRGDGVERHVLSPGAAVLLKRLARPQRVDKLVDGAAGLSESETEAALGELEERSLLFREGNQIFSLVLPFERVSQEHMEQGWSWAV